MTTFYEAPPAQAPAAPADNNSQPEETVEATEDAPLQAIAVSDGAIGRISQILACITEINENVYALAREKIVVDLGIANSGIAISGSSSPVLRVEARFFATIYDNVGR